MQTLSPGHRQENLGLKSAPRVDLGPGRVTAFLATAETLPLPDCLRPKDWR